MDQAVRIKQRRDRPLGQTGGKQDIDQFVKFTGRLSDEDGDEQPQYSTNGRVAKFEIGEPHAGDPAQRDILHQELGHAPQPHAQNQRVGGIPTGIVEEETGRDDRYVEQGRGPARRTVAFQAKQRRHGKYRHADKKEVGEGPYRQGYHQIDPLRRHRLRAGQRLKRVQSAQNERQQENAQDRECGEQKNHCGHHRGDEGLEFVLGIAFQAFREHGYKGGVGGSFSDQVAKHIGEFESDDERFP